MNYLRQFCSQPKTIRTAGNHRNYSNELLATLPFGMETAAIIAINASNARAKWLGLPVRDGVRRITRLDIAHAVG